MIISFFSVPPLVASHTSQLISGWGGAGTSEQHRNTRHVETLYNRVSTVSVIFTHPSVVIAILMNDQPKNTFWVKHLKLMVRLKRIQSKRSVVILA